MMADESKNDASQDPFPIPGAFPHDSAVSGKTWRPSVGVPLGPSLAVRLQIFIVGLVAVIVAALSLLYLHTVVNNGIAEVRDMAAKDAKQVEGFILDRVTQRAAQHQPPPQNLEEVTGLWTEIVEQDAGLATLLSKLAGSSEFVVEVLVGGPNRRILAASIPQRRGQPLPEVSAFDEFAEYSLSEKLRGVLTTSQDFEIARSLGVPGEPEPVFRVSVILSSVLLRERLQPQIERLLFVSGLSFLLAVLLATGASRFVFRPFEKIAETIDRISRGENVEDSSGGGHAKEIAAVESKLSFLGQQFRGAQQNATQLRAHVDQLLDRMEEAILLFGKENRLVMVGAGAERVLGRDRWELMGRPLEEIFPGATPLGRLIAKAAQLREPVRDQPVALDRSDGPPARLLASVEVVEEFPGRARVGTLVNLRDASSRRQLQSAIDISTRFSAIGRLTSGAAHEIKNPLNSILLHLEVLRGALDSTSPAAEKEIDVLSREINRLDRVVKSFLDFTRPVDLQVTDVDLVRLVNEAASLVRPEAVRHKVQVETPALPAQAVTRGDADLLTQALLNVVVNGMEAMPEGGKLTIAIEPSGEWWVVKIRDQGVGIPEDARATIYNLYSSTKGKGSGIGLAMTFRVMQLHGGTIDFTTEVGRGTEFRLQLPAVDSQTQQSSATSETASS